MYIEKFPCQSTLSLIVCRDGKPSSDFSEGLFLIIEARPIVWRLDSWTMSKSELSRIVRTSATEVISSNNIVVVPTMKSTSFAIQDIKFSKNALL